MDCYDEVVVYLNLNGWGLHGGETVEAHYWARDLYGGEVCAKSSYPPAVYFGESKDVLNKTLM